MRGKVNNIIGKAGYKFVYKVCFYKNNRKLLEEDLVYQQFCLNIETHVIFPLYTFRIYFPGFI